MASPDSTASFNVLCALVFPYSTSPGLLNILQNAADAVLYEIALNLSKALAMTPAQSVIICIPRSDRECAAVVVKCSAVAAFVVGNKVVGTRNSSVHYLCRRIVPLPRQRMPARGIMGSNKIHL